VSLLLAAAAAPVAQGAGLSPSQILYTSDWTGPFKALALDPLGVRQPADASGLHATCRDPERTCGFVHVTASPDGRHVAFASEDYEQAWIRTVNGILLPLAHVRSLPTWSPDSRSLAYVASDGLHVANADGRSDHLVDGNTDDASPSWGPPGRGLVFLRGAIGTSTQELVRLRNGRAGTIGSAGCKTLSWSADGRFFACAWENVFDFSVYVLDAKGHSIRTRLVSDAVPQWSPKGSRLALGSVPGKTGVRILDLAAQLTGNHLLVVVPREVRDYDLRSAELLHSWSFGQVSLGRECQGWFDPGCFVGMPSGEACDITGFFTMGCGLPDLRVEDAARGLLSYVMDDEIHLRRLSDGADAIVGPGLLSRFTSSGLVYADGARLYLVTFAALPLR
jgi:WD40-like Beta Propeller Repeat